MERLPCETGCPGTAGPAKESTGRRVLPIWKKLDKKISLPWWFRSFRPVGIGWSGHEWWLQMNWDDYQKLGGALLDAYPDANYLTMTDDTLQRLVAALPDFEGGSSRPDAAALAAIRFAWIAAAEGEDDSGPYDGSA